MPAPPPIAPPPASLPVWLPPEGVRRVPCGEHFDAVRTPRRIGERVLAVLGERSGPVIESHPDKRLLWLVPPGVLHPRLPFYEVWGPGCGIEVPAADPGPYLWLGWHIPPHGDCLTDPGALRRALDAILPPGGGR